MTRAIILGGGMTGLAAGFTSGVPVYEAAEHPGGICSSYYIRPGSTERLHAAPADGEAYHFEIGGGHWIFGGDPAVHQFMRRMVGLESYARKSSVHLTDRDVYVPYPIQNHLRYLGQTMSSQMLVEMARQPAPFRTMKDWMGEYFGPSLCELFFYPFHDLYTAGLYEKIAPQDGYKSPVTLALAIQGAFSDVPAVGYNTRFVYPREGLNTLAMRMAEGCDVRYGKRATRIDPASRTVEFADGDSVEYDELVCTLPLNRALEMAGLAVDAPADPYSSVLVVNVGATRGPRCPDDHWLYYPHSRSGFHRVGFYSAVDRHFLPASARSANDAVSIYVERAYPAGAQPGQAETAAYTQAVVSELKELGFIADAEVADATWIDVAYTWSWPQSKWRDQALRRLEEHGIYQVGRYGRWIFQGIADSIRDGFIVGSSIGATGAAAARAQPAFAAD
jgi:protoporphyrinogen oxidase